MRYFTSDTHFGHPLVTALRGFLNNGRLRAEYRDVWQAQGRAAAHAWIKQYVRDNQTSFKAICDITRHENTIIGNINETVGRDDELWILGDLSYRCTVEHTLDCLRRINCRHLHLIIGNHDRNFRLRSNDALYENVFETIDDYREIDMELPVLDGIRQADGRNHTADHRHEPLPQTLGIGRRTRQLAGKLEQVRRCGADHRRLAALWSHASRHSRRHRSAQRERGARRMGFQASQRAADPRLVHIPARRPIKVNSTLSMDPACRMPGRWYLSTPALQVCNHSSLGHCRHVPGSTLPMMAVT